jgi:hypothetical protein
MSGNVHVVNNRWIGLTSQGWLEILREQLNQERDANRENRRIIAGLVQRVPELEPTSNSSSGPQDSSRTPTVEQENGTGPADDTDPQKRSWWRRLLDIE